LVLEDESGRITIGGTLVDRATEFVTGIVVAVCVVQILIKGVLDTINLMPILPGLLELLGLVVVGQWSWHNLTTSDKRNAVVENLQNLRKEYLG
jgi:hypothetical protein